MKKIIKINGVSFELQNNVIKLPLVERYPHRTIWDCYDRPSAKKVAIYEEWLSYANSIDAQGFTVSSYNCNFFSLTFEFRYEGVKYHANITYAHNYLYIVEE